MKIHLTAYCAPRCCWFDCPNTRFATGYFRSVKNVWLKYRHDSRRFSRNWYPRDDIPESPKIAVNYGKTPLLAEVVSVGRRSVKIYLNL